MNIEDKTPFKIIYEDNHLLACIKPHGLVTEADEHHRVALDTIMKEFVKKRDRKPGNVFLTAIHRLDKPAAGIVIFAKTSKALARMHQLMKDHEIEKTYVAYLEKAPALDKDTLIHYLVHRFHRADVTDEKTGKKAELDYIVTRKDEKGCLVTVTLHTGRYHQIRAQFAAIGSIILGDKRYGSKKHLPDEAIALFHTKAMFLHPVTKVPLVLSYPGAQTRVAAFLDKL